MSAARTTDPDQSMTLRLHRQAFGATVNAAAAVLGVAPATYRNWEAIQRVPAPAVVDAAVVLAAFTNVVAGQLADDIEYARDAGEDPFATTFVTDEDVQAWIAHHHPGGDTLLGRDWHQQVIQTAVMMEPNMRVRVWSPAVDSEVVVWPDPVTATEFLTSLGFWTPGVSGESVRARLFAGYEAASTSPTAADGDTWTRRLADVLMG